MFWDDSGLSDSAKAALLQLMRITGADRASPEHALLVLLDEAQSPLAIAARRLQPAFDPTALRRSVIQSVQADVAAACPGSWNDALLGPRLVELLKLVQSSAEWNRADRAARNRLLCTAILQALQPSTCQALAAAGIAPEKLLEQLHADDAGQTSRMSHRPRLGPTPPASAEEPKSQESTGPGRQVGRLRGAPPASQSESPSTQPAKPTTGGGRRGRAPVPTPEITADEIQCTAFAPPAVRRGETVLLQIFAHLPDHAAEANRLAREFDDAAAQRGFSNLSESVQRGQTLGFELKLIGGTADSDLATLRWTGRTGSVQFFVTAGTAETLSAVLGRVTISLDSVPVGQIAFKMAVGSAGGGLPSEPVATADRFQRYFISYASKDRPEVIKRVQMLPRIGKEFRQDLLDLDPGDRFEKRLYEFIRECDATLVFWSSNAKASEWVLKECRYCIETKGIDRLLPVIIELPPPLPPPELAELHMNDKLLYFIEPR